MCLSTIKCRERGISYQIKFYSMCTAAECAMRKKSYIKGMRERMKEREESFYHLLSRSFAHISGHYGTEKRNKENGNLRNCTIKKMNGWNEDMIYGQFIHTFLCMLCLMSLYYSAIISFPSDLCRLKSHGDQFIVSYQKFNVGEVPLDIRYGNCLSFLSFPLSSLSHTYTRTHDSNKQA